MAMIAVRSSGLLLKIDVAHDVGNNRVAARRVAETKSMFHLPFAIIPACATLIRVVPS